jgi:hypothetical protein
LEAKKQELEAEEAAKGSSNDEKTYQAIAADFGANYEAVIDMLIGNVMNVNIEIPKVIRGDFENVDDDKK